MLLLVALELVICCAGLLMVMLGLRAARRPHVTAGSRNATAAALEELTFRVSAYATDARMPGVLHRDAAPHRYRSSTHDS
jgi:hypothetical protein